jgi:hypothetical protein
MHVKPFALVAAWAALGCTLTHSLDDLKGGPLSAQGSAGASAGTAGGVDNGSDANVGGSSGAALTSGSGGAQTGGGGGTGGDISMPTGLAIVSPVDGGTIGWMSISVQFSEAVDSTTVTVPTSSACGTSTIAISTDAKLASCVPMKGAPTWDADHKVATFTPQTSLDVGSLYALHVDKSVQTQAGLPLAQSYDASVTAVYSHTITDISSNHFLDPEEKLLTSTAQYTLYAAWDDTNLYLGIQGADIATAQFNTLFVAYFGPSSKGSNVGDAFDTQTASLAFLSARGMSWRANNDPASSLNLLKYAGTWGSTHVTWREQRKDDFVQFVVPLNEIGVSAGTLSFASALISDDTTTPANSSTRAMVPSGSFSGAGYKQFDLTGHTLPSESPTLTK